MRKGKEGIVELGIENALQLAYFERHQAIDNISWTLRSDGNHARHSYPTHGDDPLNAVCRR